MARGAAEPAAHMRLLERWGDDFADPYRPTAESADVQRLAAAMAPGARLTDLGGTMSLNARLEPGGLVLRVHQPFIARRRLLAVQAVRRRLAEQGLTVPVPVARRGATLFRCGRRWAELERYLPNEKPAPTPEAYAWLFRAMGDLHRALATIDLRVPRPLIATYGPPGSLRRWLPVAEAAVRANPEAAAVARWVRDLVGRLRRQWPPATGLPTQLVHGDIRLGNVCRAPDGGTIYLDFGFLAVRPRIHELAYSLAYMVLALGGCAAPGRFAWSMVPRLVADYEAAAQVRLTPAERRALAPCAAAVPLYHAAIAGFTVDPAKQLLGGHQIPFLRLAEWLLTHPDAISWAD
jgi:Ser/Thr protein kinase RdoA (MazF antagonist)